MTLLDGNVASRAIKDELKQKVTELKNEGKKVPHLAAVLVGNNGASETYVASKVKNCQEIGFASSLVRLSGTVEEEELLTLIKTLNADNEIDGILVQLPLPPHISEEKVVDLINPLKDVDGFNPVNTGRMTQGLKTFLPATPYGILLLMEHYKIPTQGLHAVVVGRSNIAGRPMSILLSRNDYPGNCTVTLCHSNTKNVAEICRQADIIIAAIGKPAFVKKEMVKEGAVVIDVGITRVADATKKTGYTIKGDVDFEQVAPKCSYISPVPGGVGLMTIAALLKNTYEASVALND